MERRDPAIKIVLGILRGCVVTKIPHTCTSVAVSHQKTKVRHKLGESIPGPIEGHDSLQNGLNCQGIRALKGIKITVR